MKETVFLPAAVKINMDNYHTNDVYILRERAVDYLNSLRGKIFSLEETNPDIKFTLSRESVWHLTANAGVTKLKITKQLPEIVRQGMIVSVEDEMKKDTNVEHILKCSSYIMINGELYAYYFVLKMKKGGTHFIYSGAIDVEKPEKNKTAQDKYGESNS